MAEALPGAAVLWRDLRGLTLKILDRASVCHRSDLSISRYEVTQVAPNDRLCTFPTFALEIYYLFAATTTSTIISILTCRRLRGNICVLIAGEYHIRFPWGWSTRLAAAAPWSAFSKTNHDANEAQRISISTKVSDAERIQWCMNGGVVRVEHAVR